MDADEKRTGRRYGQLHADLSAILFRHDPYGLNFKDNTDEYDPEARTILPRLSRCQCQEDVLNVIVEEFTRWFGGVNKITDRYRDAAVEMWARWQEEKAEGQSTEEQP